MLTERPRIHMQWRGRRSVKHEWSKCKTERHTISESVNSTDHCRLMQQWKGSTGGFAGEHNCLSRSLEISTSWPLANDEMHSSHTEKAHPLDCTASEVVKRKRMKKDCGGELLNETTIPLTSPSNEDSILSITVMCLSLSLSHSRPFRCQHNKVRRLF